MSKFTNNIYYKDFDKYAGLLSREFIDFGVK